MAELVKLDSTFFEDHSFRQAVAKHLLGCQSTVDKLLLNLLGETSEQQCLVMKDLLYSLGLTCFNFDATWKSAKNVISDKKLMNVNNLTISTDYNLWLSIEDLPYKKESHENIVPVLAYHCKQSMLKCSRAGFYSNPERVLLFGSDHREINKNIGEKVMNCIIESNDNQVNLRSNSGEIIKLDTINYESPEDILHLFKRIECSWRHPDGASAHLSGAYLFESTQKVQKIYHYLILKHPSNFLMKIKRTYRLCLMLKCVVI